MLGMLLIFILCMIGILFFIYWIPKKLGYPKVGKYLAIILSVILVLIVLYGVFQDVFFTKNQAKELLKEQNVTLQDDFEILNNKTISPLAEYYHRFRLEISENDKNRIVEEIKTSEGFKGVGKEKIDFISNLSGFNTSKTIQNYEDNNMFVKEFFKPNIMKVERLYTKELN